MASCYSLIFNEKLSTTRIGLDIDVTLGCQDSCWAGAFLRKIAKLAVVLGHISGRIADTADVSHVSRMQMACCFRRHGWMVCWVGPGMTGSSTYWYCLLRQCRCIRIYRLHINANAAGHRIILDCWMDSIWYADDSSIGTWDPKWRSRIDDHCVYKSTCLFWNRMSHTASHASRSAQLSEYLAFFSLPRIWIPAITVWSTWRPGTGYKRIHPTAKLKTRQTFWMVKYSTKTSRTWKTQQKSRLFFPFCDVQIKRKHIEILDVFLVSTHLHQATNRFFMAAAQRTDLFWAK